MRPHLNLLAREAEVEMLESRGPTEQVRASLYQEVGAERFA